MIVTNDIPIVVDRLVEMKGGVLKKKISFLFGRRGYILSTTGIKSILAIEIAAKKFIISILMLNLFAFIHLNKHFN